MLKDQRETAQRLGASLSGDFGGVAVRRRRTFIDIRRVASRIGICLAVIAAGWLFAFGMGLAPWLGYAAGSQSGGGDRSAADGRFVGTAHGIRTFPLVSGQEFLFHYDVTVRSGRLAVGFGPYLLGGGPAKQLSFRTSGNGDLVIPIEKTGIYRLQLYPASDGAGYDIAYHLRWGARPGSE